ncbi:MAG: ABC transporter ATP-binding protein [Gammaproteobacteria bacterium]|jgi:Cu-processing system ATP-binding protein|nr:ABC transporter ATP-binding protein [Gammaproteobacteria bacterium]
MVEFDAVNPEVISLQSVSKQYGNETVVSNVDLNVQAGECVVLVGHNGAGKTTLMKLMLGLTRASSGSVEVLGSNPAFNASVALHKRLGYLPESVAFHEAMTGREVLRFYARLKAVSNIDCEKLLELVGLADASKRRVGTYSKGMRQRLGLAQAMLGDPQLLFLDEPTTGLDPILRQHFYPLIDDLHKEGATSIISSHALNEVEARADRFIIMKGGVVVANGTLDELYKLSALPVRLKISVSPGEANNVAQRLDSVINIDRVGDQDLILSCSIKEKMPLIRRITELGENISDLQISPPRLDEVYSFFMSDDQS